MHKRHTVNLKVELAMVVLNDTSRRSTLLALDYPHYLARASFQKPDHLSSKSVDGCKCFVQDCVCGSSYSHEETESDWGVYYHPAHATRDSIGSSPLAEKLKAIKGENRGPL